MEIENIGLDNKKKEEHKKESKGSLAEFKKTYEEFRKKYSLPDYEFLNVNFEIELLSDIETELLMKRIRKQINERISAGLRTMEMFLNPQSVPLFIYGIIKAFTNEDREIITKLYKKFAEYEIEAFALENSYDEKKEAEFIKKVCGEWKEISEEMAKINESMKFNIKKDSKVNEKSYFG